MDEQMDGKADGLINSQTVRPMKIWILNIKISVILMNLVQKYFLTCSDVFKGNYFTINLAT